MEAQEVSGPEGGGMKKAPPARKPRVSEAQLCLAAHLKELGCKSISFEYKFNTDRKWRADICAFGPEVWDGLWLFECDGGMFHGGHKRGVALEKDYERQNWAAAHGFKLFRFTNRQILNGLAKSWLAEHLRALKERES